MNEVSDFNRQVIMRLDNIDKNTVSIIASSSGNTASLAALQKELSSYRTTLHDRFNVITEKFADIEIESEKRDMAIAQLEFRVNLIYRVLAGIGAVVLASIGLLSGTFQGIVQSILGIAPK